MKKTYKLFATTLALVMLIAIVAMPAAAFTYTAVNGGTTTFTTTLDNNGAPVPAWEVTYAIAAGSGETSEGVSTIAGPTPDSVVLKIGETALTDGKVTFTAGDAETTKTVTVDFSGVTFNQPGVYRYTLTQTATALEGMTLDTQPVRTLDIYVVDSEGTLVVRTYLFRTTAGKSDAFLNGLGTTGLTVSKAVTGIFASREKYFKFTVTVTGLDTTKSYSITVPETAPATNSTTTYTTMSNPTSATGEELAAGVDIYLQHGQSATIAGLPYGAQYTVIEDKEDYTNEPPANATGTIANDAVTVAFVNAKEGEVPTGVLLTVIPGAVLLGAGVIGFLVMSRKKKNEDEAEEE